jgi:transposase
VAATYNPKTDHMVWAMSKSNDSDLLEVLLRMVADRYRGWETVHLVMDNYSTHTSNQTDRVIEELDGHLQRHFLPPYCPEANPIERVWWDVHDNVTRNHRCDSLQSLLEEV